MTIAVIYDLHTKFPTTLCCLEIISFNEGRNRQLGQRVSSLLKFLSSAESWRLNLIFPSSIGASAPGSGTFLQSSKMTCCFRGYSVLRRGIGAAIVEDYSALVGPRSCSG